MGDAKPKKRRWFRFSLRTMLVLMTVFCIWLGWQVSIVRERKAVLAELKRHHPTGTSYICLETFLADPAHQAAQAHPDVKAIRISWFRRLLGDETCVSLGTPGPLDPAIAERMERAFPEAKLSIYLAGEDAYRDSLYTASRRKNRGAVFNTGVKQ